MLNQAMITQVISDQGGLDVATATAAVKLMDTSDLPAATRRSLALAINSKVQSIVGLGKGNRGEAHRQACPHVHNLLWKKFGIGCPRALMLRLFVSLVSSATPWA